MFLPDSARYKRRRVTMPDEPSFLETIGGALPGAALGAIGGAGGALLTGGNPVGVAMGGALGAGLGAPLSQEATGALAGTTSGEQGTGELTPLASSVRARELARQRWAALRQGGQQG